MNGGWQPIRDTHSIESVAAIVAFPEPLNDKMLRRTLRVADAVSDKAQLTVRESMSGFQLNMPTTGPQFAGLPTVDHAPLLGIQFRRNEFEKTSSGDLATVTVEELRIERQAIVYGTTRYDRWHLYNQQMTTLLKPLLDVVLAGSSVFSIRLEYRDRFNFVGQPQEARVAELLQEQSPLIAQHVFSATNLWHSHTGMFVPVEGAERRLIQIQVDATDDTEARRSVRIVTGVQDFLQTGGPEATEQDSAAILAQFVALHVASKDLFRQMLTTESAERVGLSIEEMLS